MNTYGIIGHRINQSLLPAMHNAAIKHLGLDAQYHRIPISLDSSEELANFCYETDLNEIGGFSVTNPFKQEIMNYMDHFDPAAKIIGSINTVLNEESLLIGYNTNTLGSLEAIKEKVDPKDRKVLVLGAGTAARAIIYTLKEYGAEVYIYNRTPKKAEEITKSFEIESLDELNEKVKSFDIIINATSVGSEPHSSFSLLNSNQISKSAVVMDIVIDPIETELIREAKKAGAKTITGERMLLYLAIRQFEIWFKQEAPREVMEKALYDEIGKRK